MITSVPSYGGGSFKRPVVTPFLDPAEVNNKKRQRHIRLERTRAPKEIISLNLFSCFILRYHELESYPNSVSVDFFFSSEIKENQGK